MIFPISKVKAEILREVYQEKKITISALLHRKKVSPKSGYRYVDELIRSGILGEEKEGKKPTLRYLLPRFSDAGRLCFSLIEEDRKLRFLERQKELRGPMLQLARELKGIGVILIFGSFARGGATKESDIDIMIIGKVLKRKTIGQAAERCLITLRNRYSLRLVRENDFAPALRKGDSFARQVEKDHVILEGSLAWVRIVAEAFQKS